MLRKFEKIYLKIEKILKKLRQPCKNIRKYSVINNVLKIILKIF